MRDINDFSFSGPFAEEIPHYVQHKRACGFKVAESDLYRLREMDRFFGGMGVTAPVITREMYEKWTSVKSGERNVTASRRRTILSSFGKYLLPKGTKIFTRGMMMSVPLKATTYHTFFQKRKSG